MKKIPTLFQRNFETDRLVRDELMPGCEWVLNGEGIATEKMDGTCCLIRDGKLYKRYELKRGKKAPEGFEPAQEADDVTGDIPGWLPVGEGAEDKWHREAMENGQKFAEQVEHVDRLPDGTYELLGPKVQGNPHQFHLHCFYKHGDMKLADVPHDFDGLREYLREHKIEGIVWHHPDGRMAKLKRTDFGFAWGSKKAR